MENIIRYPTNTTPFVYTCYNQGLVYISGVAIPENASQFFAGLTDWIKTFLEQEKRMLFLHIDLEYVNDSSSLCIRNIFKILNIIDNNLVTLSWYYYSDDDDVREDGEVFASTAWFPFILVPIERSESVNISKTADTPLLYLDLQGDFILSGNARSKNPFHFYFPAIKWLQNRRTNNTPESINFEISVQQLDVKNIPFVTAMCHFVEILNNKGCKSTIVWKYGNAEVEQIGIDMLRGLALHYYFKEIE
jgi:hypothetical protein